MNRIVIVGCGYIGVRVARLWREQGAQVACLVRTPDKCVTLAQEGFSASTVLLDEPSAIVLPDLAGTILYYLVPPPGGGSATPGRRISSLPWPRGHHRRGSFT